MGIANVGRGGLYIHEYRAENVRNCGSKKIGELNFQVRALDEIAWKFNSGQKNLIWKFYRPHFTMSQGHEFMEE